MRNHPLVSGMDFLSNSSLMKNSGFVFGDNEIMIALNGVRITNLSLQVLDIIFHRNSKLRFRERTNWKYTVMKFLILDMGIENDDEGETH